MSRGPYKKNGRISRAEANRRMAAIEAELARPAVLSAEAAELIDKYTSPSLPTVHAGEIKAFMRTVIAASRLTGRESIRKNVTHLMFFGLYGIERGLPLTVEAMMATTVIDDFTRRSADGDHLRAERRRRLLWLATQVNPGPTTPSRLSPIGHAAVKAPYTPAEMTTIRRYAMEQPTAAKRRNLCAVVGIGAGCGGDSPDLRSVLKRHVNKTEAGIFVAFQQPRPRVVVCRAAYEALLDVAAVGAADSLLYGVKADRRNIGARAVDDATLHGCPHIEPSRLRSTWLADLMTDPIPLAVILKAAGLRSARSLAELVPHLGPWMELKDLTPIDLRGETR